MLQIAKFSMNGPMQALLSVFIFSALSVWVAPLGILAGAIIALVTLRVSVTEGFKALVWGVAVHIAVIVMMTGSYLPGIISIFEYMIPVWLMSVVLRQTNSLATALQFAMIIAGLGLIGFYLMVPNPAEWWLNLFNLHLAPMLQKSGMEYQPEVIEKAVELVTMFMASFVVVLWFSILVVGRWWQSELYNPGQFKADFHQLRLPKSTAYTAIVLAVLGLGLGDGQGIIYDLSGVMIVGLMIQGISIAHHTVAVRQLHTAWLVGLYILLALFPQMMLILATIGLVDTWVDFRNRWEKEEL